jgi:hypothetical protein
LHPLGASVETHDFRSIPFGSEEDADRRIISARFGTQIPGGFGAGSLVVPRVEGIDPIDAPLLAGARFYGPGNRTAYEGRIAGAPRIGVNEIELELEGWSAHLDDDIFRELYVNRDLQRWQGPSVQRRLNLIDAAFPHQNDAAVIPDETSGEALRLAVTGAWTSIIPVCDTWLDAGAGLKVARLMGSWEGVSNLTFELRRFQSDDDVTPADQTDIYSAGTGTLDYQPTTPMRRVGFTWLHPVTGGGDNEDNGVVLRNLAVYGDHGLTLYDTEDGGADGVRGDDVLRDALARACPLLNLDDIEEASFIIPELVFDGWESRARNVVEEVTRLGGATAVPNEWGVYENRRFFWRTAGSYGTAHTVRLDEGVEVGDEGEDTTGLATAVIATFTDATGAQKAYGYTDSGADFESDLLSDTDPLNPFAASEVERKVITKDVGRTSPEGALLLGQLTLQEATRTTRTGSYRIPLLANDEPPYYCRAGDRLIVSDDYALKQSIVSTEYDHSTGYLEAQIGAPAKRLDVAIAQLAAAAA